MAKVELGTKRQCQSCSTKFFDLNHDPIKCPKCGTLFQVAAVTRPARAAPRAQEEVEADPAGVELVSLEDAEPGEKVEAAAEGDIEVEDTQTDDTFLEEEEEGDGDVSDLIDGDLEDDEEA